MDAVFADPSPAHDHQVPMRYAFFIRRFSTDRCRHDTDGGHKNQTFSHVAMMKKDLTKWRRNAAFVPAIPHPFDYTVQKPTWMKTRFEVSGIIPRSHTETVTSHDQFRPQTGAHRVAVYAHNSGQCAPICFHV